MFRENLRKPARARRAPCMGPFNSYPELYYYPDRVVSFSFSFILPAAGGTAVSGPRTIFRSDRILTEYYGVLSDLLSRIALRLIKIIEPYLVEQERMANAQLLMYAMGRSIWSRISFFILFF